MHKCDVLATSDRLFQNEIMADNLQRFSVICNQVNLNVLSNIRKSPDLCSLNIIKSPILFVQFV